MKPKIAMIGCAALAIILSVFSCRSESPRVKGEPLSVLTWVQPSGPSDLAGGRARGGTFLDSNTGADAGKRVSGGSTATGSPVEAQWAKGVLKDEVDTYYRSTSVDSAGNVYAAGYVLHGGLAHLGDGIAVHGIDLGANVMIVKYDSSGRTIWARSVEEGSTISRFYSVAVDASGNAYAVGIVGKGVVKFGGNVTVEGKFEGMNLLLVKYDASGQAQWARTLASAHGDSEFNSVAVDGEGRVYATGYFVANEGESIDFPHQAPRYKATPQGVGGGAVLAQLDSNGDVLWVAQVAGKRSSSFYSVTVDESGNAYVAGYILADGTYAFGNGVLLKGPSKKFNTILVKYDNAGKARWARSNTDGGDNCMFYSVSLDSTGNIYAAGEIKGKGEYDFGSEVTVHGSSEKRNPLLVKYDSSGATQWVRSLVSGPGDFEYHASAVDDRYVYLAGALEIKSKNETYDFGTGRTVQSGRYSGLMEFVLAYDFSGTPKWVLMPPSKGAGRIEIRSICPTGSDSLIMAGTLVAMGSLDLGGGVTVDGSYPSHNLFLAKYRRGSLPPEQ